MDEITVSVVEDVPEIREGMRFMINQMPGFRCVAVYGNAQDAIRGMKEDTPDMAIVDIGLPGMSGAECIRRLREAGLATKCLVFTIYEDDDQVFEVLAAGANGYLLKTASPDRIMEALQDLHNGGAPMSPSIARKIVASFHTPTDHEMLSSREKEVLHLMAKGYMYKEISDKLDIRIGTVRQHIHHIYEKLHVQNRTEAINKALGSRSV
jgi:DNA-binding NarL/FixJ family response regulator